MSKSLDKLSHAIDNTVKTSAGTTISKDTFIDLIDESLGYLYNVSQFFTAIGDNAPKLQSWIATNRRETKFKSIVYYNKIESGLTGPAKSAFSDRFLGAMLDTTNALIIILEDISSNIDKFFTDKTITVYNTKISQVAIIGMLENAKTFTEFVCTFVALFMADRNSALTKPERYTIDFMDKNVDDMCALMNRTLNSKLSKTFTSALIKYRNGGADVTVVNSENKPTVQFAKISSEVTEHDISSGAKGFKIFRIIGNFITDWFDKGYRKKVALREQFQARARLLQLELDGVDPNSAEYVRLTKIIANYQKLIDRLNQQIAKYEEED